MQKGSCFVFLKEKVNSKTKFLLLFSKEKEKKKEC